MQACIFKLTHNNQKVQFTKVVITEKYNSTSSNKSYINQAKISAPSNKMNITPIHHTLIIFMITCQLSKKYMCAQHYISHLVTQKQYSPVMEHFHSCPRVKFKQHSPVSEYITNHVPFIKIELFIYHLLTLE